MNVADSAGGNQCVLGWVNAKWLIIAKTLSCADAVAHDGAGRQLAYARLVNAS